MVILLIIGGSASQKLAADIAKELEDNFCPIETKKFPDGERYIRIKGEVEKEVVVVQSTGYPQDENLIELLFLIKNLKELGAEKIIAIIPYFGYGRQEKRFKEGEAISAKITSNFIEDAGADEVLSINLHEEKVMDFFKIPSKNISAMPAIAEYLSNTAKDPIIIAPDKGALGFAEEISEILNCSCTYMEKVRISPTEVKTQIAKINSKVSNGNKVDIESVNGKEAIIIDDIIATGGTIVNAIEILKKQKAKSVSVCCVHPVLVNDAVLKIYAAGAKEIVGTNTLNSEVSSISLAKLIANALKK